MNVRYDMDMLTMVASCFSHPARDAPPNPAIGVMHVKRLFTIFLTLLLFAPASSLAAQEPVDIPALAEKLASTDSERLLMRLNTPIPDELLSGPFSGARPMDPNLMAEQRATFEETLEGITGSVVYTIGYTPVGMTSSPASATPSGTPAARSPQAVFTSATLSYLLFLEPVDTSDMDAFGGKIQTAMGSEAAAGTVEQITIGDSPAVLISTVAVVNAVDFHSQWIALPVGNVVVIAMVLEGSDPFDEAHFRADNEALVLNGVAYLQSIVSE
jgi:hypothetical protein